MDSLTLKNNEGAALLAPDKPGLRFPPMGIVARSPVVIHPLNGFTTELPIQWKIIVQDTRISNCTPYLQAQHHSQAQVLRMSQNSGKVGLFSRRKQTKRKGLLGSFV
jgi:hypothetical protein